MFFKCMSLGAWSAWDWKILESSSSYFLVSITHRRWFKSQGELKTKQLRFESKYSQGEMG